MLDDFTPIIHSLDGRTVKVWAVADVHIGAKDADVQGFADFLAKSVEPDPDSYMVIVGDLLENNTKESVSGYGFLPPSAQIDHAVELLEPVKDKILGCVGGNHEHRSKSVDLDPLYTVMLMLGKGELYRQNMAFVRVNLERGNTRDHYALMLVHGRTANKKRHFSYSIEGVSAIISAHTHDGLVEKPAKLVFTKANRVKVQPIVSMTATSWLPFSDYAARSLCLPKATSDPQHLLLEFAGTNSRQGNVSVVW